MPERANENLSGVDARASDGRASELAPRRILFLLQKLEGGGAERQLLVLADALTKRGHDVTLAVYYSGGPYESLAAELGIRVVCLQKGGTGDNLGFLRRVIRLVRDLAPHVIHGYMDTGNIVASAMKPFARRSRIAWGVRASNLDLSKYDRRGRTLFQLTRLASRTADVIISNSQSGADHVIRAGYPAERIVVIPNGIDTVRFAPAPDRAKTLRAEWGVTHDEHLVGLVARLDPMKDHSTFATAARILADRRPEVRFICFGEGTEPYRSQALAALQNSGLGERMLVRSFSHEMPAVYSALDIATSSSAFGEGFSNAIAEAMACGTPCAVTDVGDSRLIVGDTGIVVRPRDADALAVAWETLLERAGPPLSDSCRQRIVANFGVEHLTQATIRALALESEHFDREADRTSV